jgi:hypothetical protein
VSQINSVEDFWKMVDECKADGLAEWDPEMVRRIAQAIKDSNFPVNSIVNELDKDRTEVLRLAAEAGVSGFTRFN